MALAPAPVVVWDDVIDKVLATKYLVEKVARDARSRPDLDEDSLTRLRAPEWSPIGHADARIEWTPLSTCP